MNLTSSSATSTNQPTSDIEKFHGSSLELQNLTMAYGDVEVLRNVSLNVAPGTTTCIIGPPSGSGKSTLLRGVNRLHEPRAAMCCWPAKAHSRSSRTSSGHVSVWCSSTSTSSRTTLHWKTWHWPVERQGNVQVGGPGTRPAPPG